MSTSTKATSKPKRPLSGYNLFYRYKRNKVVEATARRNINDDDRRAKAVIHGVLTALPGLEDVPPVFPLFDLPPARLNEFRAANIRKAMEGKLFPNENARKRVHCKVHGMGFVEMGRVMRQMWAQADKLTKDVFGELADVGRVRYRRLAAEYRLSGERPETIKSEAMPDYEDHKTAETSALKPARTVNKSEEVAPAGSFPATLAAAVAVDPMTTEATANAKASETSLIPQQAGSSSEPMLEELSAWMTKNRPVAVAAASESNKGSRPSCGRRVSMDVYAPVPREAHSHGRSLFKPLAVTSTMNPTANAASDARPRHQRPASTAARLALCDDSLFEPLPVERPPETSDGHGRRVSTDVAPRPNWRAATGDGGWAPATSGHGRRVSTDVSPVLHGSMGAIGARAAVAMGNMGNGSAGSHSAHANLEGLKTNPELQQIVLSNAIKNLKDRIIQNNSLLPSGMRVFPKGGISPQAHENNVGGKPHPEIMTSSGPSILSSHVAADNNANPGGGGSGSEKRASAQGSAEFKYEPDDDFVKLINELDKAIDDHGIAVGATREKADLAAGIADGAYSSPSSIFGKPTFDMPGPGFGDKPASFGQTTVPMPAGVELKNHRARMA